MQHAAAAERDAAPPRGGPASGAKGSRNKVEAKAEEPSDYYLLHAVRNYAAGLKCVAVRTMEKLRIVT
jgi:hypothetical protein